MSPKSIRYWENVCSRVDEHEPLKVTAVLASAIAGPPHVHLDALLTIVALHWAHYPGHDRPYSPTSADRVVPVAIPVTPDESGVWRCSTLTPDDDTARGETHWHMAPYRQHMHLTTANQVTTTNGHARAVRRRLPLTATPTLTAHLIGDGDRIDRLLGRIGALGHKRSQGYGRVAAWTVESDDTAHDLWRTTPDGHAARPLPDPDGAPLGLRPPYWYRPWWRPGIPEGYPTPP